MSKNISEMEKKWSSPGSKIDSTSREALTKNNMIHIFFLMRLIEGGRTDVSFDC